MELGRYLMAAVLWTAAIVLMISEVARDEGEVIHMTLLLAAAAHTVTIWAILSHERHRAETIARLAAMAVLEEADIKHIH